MKVERSIGVAAPPQEIYAVVMDPHRLGDWVTIHERLEDTAPGELKKGSTLTQRLKLAGRGFKVEWEVVEDDCPTRVVWHGRGPMRSKAGVVYEFEADGHGGTRFSYTNEYELPGGPLGKMAGPAVRRVTAGELDESLRRLKALVE